jgi:hypothetical protein
MVVEEIPPCHEAINHRTAPSSGVRLSTSKKVMKSAELHHTKPSGEPGLR